MRFEELQERTRASTPFGQRKKVRKKIVKDYDDKDQIDN